MLEPSQHRATHVGVAVKSTATTTSVEPHSSTSGDSDGAGRPTEATGREERHSPALPTNTHASGGSPLSRTRKTATMRPMRRLSSTESSLDADDEADSSSRTTTPPTGSRSSTSHWRPASPNRAAKGYHPVARKTVKEDVPAGGNAALPTGLTAAAARETASRAPSFTQPAAVAVADSRAKEEPAADVVVDDSSSGCVTTPSRTPSVPTAAASGDGNGDANGDAGVPPPAADRQAAATAEVAAAGLLNGGTSPLRPDPKHSAPATTAAESAAVQRGATASSPASTPAMASVPVSSTMGCGSSVNLEQFGCCVFFFPTPFLSWLLPLSGHVAISNAEGTRLYTFESSYFVREERMVDVLDRVVENIRGNYYDSPRASCGVASSGAFSDGGPAKSSRSNIEGRNGGRASLDSDNVFPSVDSPVSSPLPGSASSGGEDDDAAFNSSGHVIHRGRFSSFRRRSGRSYPGSPIRRQVKQLSSFNSGSHSHTSCVRIWDLKSLLMESRGRGGGQPSLPLRLVSSVSGGSSTVLSLWQRLQELIPVEGVGSGAGSGSGSEGSSTLLHSHGPKSAVTAGRNGALGEGEGHTGSGSETEDERNRLLDPVTARFYNRNLQATINIFRGSPEGSRAPLDIIVKSTNSYSFVGFVLETCGLGGGPTLTPTTTATTTEATPATPATEGHSTAASSTMSGTKPQSGESTDAPVANPDQASLSAAGAVPPTATSPGTDAEVVVDGIAWGVWKIWLNVFLFGEWYRSERRVWRVTHGGTMAGAFVVWAALIILVISFVIPFTNGWWSGGGIMSAGSTGNAAVSAAG